MAMKVYETTEQDFRSIGWTGDLDKSINLSGVQFVKSPKEADVVIAHLSLRETHLSKELFKKLVEYLGVDERRVAAYDCSDHEEDYSEHNPLGLFIRCNTKGWMKRRMPRTVSWAWPVEDLKAQMPIPGNGFKYDIGFQGWRTSSNVRAHSIDSVIARGDIKFDLAQYSDFYGYIEKTPEGARRKAEFMRSLSECPLQLTPCSIHNVFPYRFFEAMSAGRVPVLFCTDFVYPFADKIDYSSCTFAFPADRAPEAGNLVREILNSHSTEKLIEMGKKGREYWDKWLNKNKFNDLKRLAIYEALKKDGLIN